jgi:hypothetical protein
VQPSIGVGTDFGEITLSPEFGGGTLTQQEANAARLLSMIPANARRDGESNADYIKRLIAAARSCPNPKIDKVYGPAELVSVWTPPYNFCGNGVATYCRMVYTRVNGRVISKVPEYQDVYATTNGTTVSFDPPPGWGGDRESEIEKNPDAGRESEPGGR